MCHSSNWQDTKLQLYFSCRKKQGLSRDVGCFMILPGKILWNPFVGHQNLNLKDSCTWASFHGYDKFFAGKNCLACSHDITLLVSTLFDDIEPTQCKRQAETRMRKIHVGTITVHRRRQIWCVWFWNFEFTGGKTSKYHWSANEWETSSRNWTESEIIR